VAIGDGATASFWHDSWLFGSAPKSLAPTLYRLSRRKHIYVREALRDGDWVLDLRGRMSPDLLDIFVTFRALLGLAQLCPDVEDRRLLCGLGISAPVCWGGGLPLCPPHLEALGHATLSFLRPAVRPKLSDDGGPVSR
jgi:hypothetical protein